jgi:hypothetical protein
VYFSGHNNIIGTAYLGFDELTVTTCATHATHFVEYGLWPVKLRALAFIPFELMYLLSTLTNFSPVTSLTSIVNALNFNNERYSNVSLTFLAYCDTVKSGMLFMF